MRGGATPFYASAIDRPDVVADVTADKCVSRRAFTARALAVAGVGAVAPFSFVRRVSASELARFVDRTRERIQTPGIAVALVRGGHVAWSTASGWANVERGVRASPDTAFMLASVSKTVTCAGIMALVERGKLDLDADINDALPFEVRVPAAPAAAITMRQLLVHTSALRDRSVWGTPHSSPTLYFHGDSPIGLGEFMRSYFSRRGSRYRANGNFYDRKPGKAYDYSNLAVALAGHVAEEVSGVDFDAWCRHEILRPLGMDRSGFRLADVPGPNTAMPYFVSTSGAFSPYFQYGYPDYPDGALRTSAVHLARWLGAFMNFGVFGGSRVLERATVQEIRRNQIPSIASWHQGLIWYGGAPNGYLKLGHTGGDFGMSTRMFFRPDREVGVVSLTNAYLYGSRWRRFRDIELRLFDEFS